MGHVINKEWIHTRMNDKFVLTEKVMKWGREYIQTYNLQLLWIQNDQTLGTTYLHYYSMTSLLTIKFSGSIAIVITQVENSTFKAKPVTEVPFIFHTNLPYVPFQ